MEIYLDTSGDGLHKRGYRKRATLAPIKETLAAAIADLGRVRRDSLVQDPFCGSGTLVIEAAQKALNLAPGLGRHFAAEHFAFLPAEIWAQQREKARGEARPDAAFEGVGYDIDPAAVALASANARLAGVGDRCRFAVADIKDFTPAANATVLTNPPYGSAWATRPRPPCWRARWARSGSGTRGRGCTPSRRMPSLSSISAKRPPAAARSTTA